MYTYTADSRGYRITQHKLLPGDKKEIVNNKEDLDIVKNLDNEVSNDLVEEQERDRDVRSHRNSKKLRLRRKVLVKRHRAGKAHPKSAKIKVKKLGKAAEIIPYQPTLLLRCIHDIPCQSLVLAAQMSVCPSQTCFTFFITLALSSL